MLVQCHTLMSWTMLCSITFTCTYSFHRSSRGWFVSDGQLTTATNCFTTPCVYVYVCTVIIRHALYTSPVVFVHVCCFFFQVVLYLYCIVYEVNVMWSVSGIFVPTFWFIHSLGNWSVYCIIYTYKRIIYCDFCACTENCGCTVWKYLMNCVTCIHMLSKDYIVTWSKT